MLSSKYTIRENNQAIVLNQIIRHDDISRAELSIKTNLNKASISSIIKDLIDQSLVEEIGTGDSSIQGGRKPTLLRFNHKAGYVLAIDIGTDYIHGILSYLNGKRVHILKKENLTINSKNIFSYIDIMVCELKKYQSKSTYQIIGMSIAIHGIILENSVIFTPYYDLDKIDLINPLLQKYNFPIFIENEANLSALGEYTFKSKENQIITISMHSGVGTGIIENGEIHSGEHGLGGEFGHTILYPFGKKCPCGNEGCLEQYISQKKLYEKIESSLKLESNTIHSNEVAKLIEEDNSLIKIVMEENAKLLAIGINNLAVLFDPSLIILNSSVYRKVPKYVTTIQESINTVYLKELKVINTELGDNATLYGGIALVAQHFLNIKNLKILNK